MGEEGRRGCLLYAGNGCTSKSMCVFETRSGLNSFSEIVCIYFMDGISVAEQLLFWTAQKVFNTMQPASPCHCTQEIHEHSNNKMSEHKQPVTGWLQCLRFY